MLFRSSAAGQMKQMAYCMAQDCAQSMEQVTCRFVDANGFCYTDSGQAWCTENTPNTACHDNGLEGTWVPKANVPFFGSAAAAAKARRAQSLQAEQGASGQVPVEIVAFTPSTFYCSGTGATVGTCEECESGCLSPRAALDNRDVDGPATWNPISHVPNADDISLTVDAGRATSVASILWANAGDTTHDPAYMKVETADDAAGPWTEVIDMDMSEIRGKKTVEALPLPSPVTARYFRLSPGGIQWQTTPRAIGLCTTADCAPPPAPPTPPAAAASAATGPTYACTCFKNCAHYTGSNQLKKYRCTGGVALKVGEVEGTPAATAEISSSSKTGECACSCGIPGTDEWYAQDAQ